MVLRLFITLFLASSSALAFLNGVHKLQKGGVGAGRCFSRGFGRACPHRLYATAQEIIDKPAWAGNDDLLSKFVNSLIGFKPLFSVMKVMARNTLISTAEKNGIPWRERAASLKSQQSQLDAYFEAVSVPEIRYPEYYTREFHAYDEGNLNWLAASECESATYSMALRVWPNDGLTAAQAQDRLRFSFLDEVNAYLKSKGVASPKSIIDVGCSVGVSTDYLARFFPGAEKILGLDLSAHFLAVAKQRQDSAGINDDIGLSRISWKHAKVEESNLPAGEFDLTSVSFMFHELPQKESSEIVQELYRITRKGGVLAITDNNPRSPVIQGLPPALFTLMKSTEPHSDEYYTFDLEGSLLLAGFSDVKTVASDPRHRTILAFKN